MSGGVDECLGLIVRDLIFVNIECFHRLQMPRFFIDRVLLPIFWQTGISELCVNFTFCRRHQEFFPVIRIISAPSFSFVSARIFVWFSSA